MKYLPFLHDEVTGKLLSGGAYLFDTYENATEYLRWISEDYEVGEIGAGVNFTKQPMFEGFHAMAYHVLGAHIYLPIGEHAIVKTVKWKQCQRAMVSVAEVYPQLIASAEKTGAASFWLLHDSGTDMMAVEMAYPRVGGSDPEGALESLKAARTSTEVEDMISAKVGTRPVFDRTSVLLTLWLPKSEAAGDADRTLPYHPMVPDVSADLASGHAAAEARDQSVKML